MFRLRFLSPFKSNNSLLFKRTFKFSENKPSESKSNKIFPEESVKNSEAEQKVTPKVSNPINPPRYQQDSGKAFLNKLDRIEEAQRFGGRSRRDLKTLIFPALLCLTSVFLYHCWMTLPYSSIYKHATVNEYINQMGYYHAIFLSSLSFQNLGHFVLYFPMMVYSLLLVSKYIKQRHVALIYLTNTLLTTAATYYFEKYNKDAKLLTPKVNGSVTPLCFMSCFLTMKPNYFVFGSRLFPYFFLPFVYYMNEWNEYQIGEINEVSRPVHFTAIAWGLICGLAVRVLVGRRIV